jgi:hypothetical protein
MFLRRNRSDEFNQDQFKLKELKLELYPIGKTDLVDIIEKLNVIVEVVKRLAVMTTDTFDEPYFQFMESFFEIAKFQAAYLNALKLGDNTAEAKKGAVQFNFTQLEELVDKLDRSRPSVNEMNELAGSMINCGKLSDFYTKINELALLRFPFIYSIESNPYAHFQQHLSSHNNDETEQEIDPLLLSVQFYTDNEPWANPQLLMPQVQYTIKGVIKLNRLPEHSAKLIIRHVSTTSDEFFLLSFPEVQLTNELSYSITGQVVFKYPQSTFDPPVVIKLMAQLVLSTGEFAYPDLIGYDELIAQIIDEKTFKYPTGFKKMNRKAWDISQEIKLNLPNINKDEMEHFIILLSGILNYSGYCALQGIYKNVSTLTEDDFRDRIISHLLANPMIGEELIKEGNIAGGRVEIRYKNIIAELKVEKSITDRSKMVDRYKRQPSVYASAASADLAILCILDLTVKTLPSAPAANNVFLIPAEFHGFDNTVTTSKIAVVVIDGNLKNPSAY